MLLLMPLVPLVLLVLLTLLTTALAVSLPLTTASSTPHHGLDSWQADRAAEPRGHDAAAPTNRVTVWWKPSNASSLRTDVAGMKQVLFATDVIVYCGFAPLVNGSFGVPSDASAGWGDPDLCRPALSEARRGGLSAQLVVEGRFDEPNIHAAVARGGTAFGDDVVDTLRRFELQPGADGVAALNFDWEPGKNRSALPPSEAAAAAFTAALAQRLQSVGVAVTVDAQPYPGLPWRNLSSTLMHGGVHGVFAMALYHGTSSSEWTTKLSNAIQSLGTAGGGVSSAGTFAVAMQAGQNKFAWENTTASIAERFAAIKRAGIRHVAIFAWARGGVSGGNVRPTPEMLSEWSAQLRKFVALEPGALQHLKTDDQAHSSGRPIRVSYASSPALPGQTVMIQGQGLRNLTAQICTHGTGCADAEVLSSAEQSAKVLVPHMLRLAQYSLRLCDAEGECTLPTAAATTVNTPFISWFQGDQGNGTTAGGWIRLFGRSLAFGSDRCVSDGPRPDQRAPMYDWEPYGIGQAPPLAVGVSGKLVSGTPANGVEVELELVKATCYSLWFRVPTAASAGRYHLLLRNGLSTNWSGPVAEDGETVGSTVIEIKPVREWPQQKFVVATCQGLQDNWPSWCGTSRDSTIHNLTTALAAAAAAGGGVIWLQQGVYHINASLGTLYIPPNTELRGESAELVSLLWPPFLRQTQVDILERGFLAGSDFKLTNLSIYAGPGKFREVVHVMQNSTRAVLDGLHIRANPYAGLMDAGGDHWKNNVDEDGRFSYSTNVSLSGAVHIGGKNTLVQNCDIEGIGSTTILLGGGYVHGTVIVKNRIGFAGQLFELGYQATAVFRTIIEGNLIYARAPAAMNSMMATYGAARMDMLYVHNNAWANPSSGYASGMISEDGSGGAYNNTVESVSADGLVLTLRNDSLSRPLRLKGQHFIGAAVYVIAGPGAGQWRRVVGFQNQDHDQDEDEDHLAWRIASPFTIPLDPLLSFVVIGPYRGKLLITGNTAVDTQGSFLWGSCLECVIADNVWSRSQAIDLIPLNDHNAGPQPNFRVFVLDNAVRSSMFYRAGYFACGPAPNHLNLGGEGKPCLPNQSPLVGNSIEFASAISGGGERYNSTRLEEHFRNLFLARGLLVRGNTFTKGSVTLGWGLTEVVVEQNEFEGVGTGVCLSNNRGQNNHVKPTLADAAETELIYRLNKGPSGEAVTMCANCEIAMQTNGYGHLKVEDQRSQCIPIDTNRSRVS